MKPLGLCDHHENQLMVKLLHDVIHTNTHDNYMHTYINILLVQ